MTTPGAWGLRPTAAPALDWLNKGIFVGVGGRQASGVADEGYLVA